ncbi:MAG TPA: NAD(P)-dependent oxidoreductase, partial [Prevotella sp.]|nr:NAD(P)-dependent oxidoreductase [Prevotella sp.]
MEKRKICMVTGATSGIGEACALRFAKEGYDVIITGRREALLNTLAQRIEAMDVCAKKLCFDVRNQQQTFDACGSLEAEWADIDVLINNAGLALGLDPLQSGDPEDWNTMIDTNIKGLLYVSRAIVPGMVERNHGEIINIGSVAGD